MKDVNIRDLQLAELEILKEFIRVCKELNLRYFLDAGTLLGCIRHKGFIPWDDDIDVCMPREDYEKLLEKGQKVLKERYFLQNYKTDKEVTINFSKIRDSQTTFIESTVQNLNINHGVYIDIFPIDGYNPRDKFQNFKFILVAILHKIYFAKEYTLKDTKRLKIKIMKLLQKVLAIIYRNKTNEDLLIVEKKIAQKYKYENSIFTSSYSYTVSPPTKLYTLKEYFGNRNNKDV